MMHRILDIVFDLRDVIPDGVYKMISDCAGRLHDSHRVQLLLHKRAGSPAERRLFRQIRREQDRDMHVFLNQIVPLLLRARRELRRVS